MPWTTQTSFALHMVQANLPGPAVALQPQVLPGLLPLSSFPLFPCPLCFRHTPPTFALPAQPSAAHGFARCLRHSLLPLTMIGSPGVALPSTDKKVAGALSLSLFPFLFFFSFLIRTG